MKNIIFKTTALTLIELIFAATLVSVVLLGLFSVTTVLSTNSQDYGQKYLLASQTQATLNHILGNASLAVGSNTNVGSPSVSDQGILIGAQMGAADNNSFCIHQQPGGNDTWLCYTLAAHQITYCNKPYILNDGSGFRGAGGACSAAATFLGTAYGFTAPIITNPVSPSYTNSTFSITIENCLNDSAATGTCVPDCRYSSAVGCVNGGTTDFVNNPEVVTSGSTAALQQGT